MAKYLLQDVKKSRQSVSDDRSFFCLTQVLKDSEYGVAVNAVKLRRRVEMYQWNEEEHVR